MSAESASYVAAFGGGVASFLSPCVLPIVPAYLSLITGLDLTTAQDGSRRHLARVARDTGLFVAGFSAVFVVLGLSATTIGRNVFGNQVLLTRVSGLVVLAMALFLLGSLVVRARGCTGSAASIPTCRASAPQAARGLRTGPGARWRKSAPAGNGAPAERVPPALFVSL